MDNAKLNTFINDIAISKKAFLSYPLEHPVISNMFNRLKNDIDSILLVDDFFVLGINKDKILFMIGESKEEFSINTNSLLYFSQTCIELGISIIKIFKNIDNKTISSLLEFFTFKRENVFANGGPEQVWSSFKTDKILIQGIDYDKLITSEKNNDIESIFNHILNNNMDSYGIIENNSELSPEKLASILNKNFEKGIDTQKLCCDIAQTWSSESDFFNDSVVAFISALNPKLRILILDESFSLMSLEETKATLKTISNKKAYNFFSEISQEGERIPEKLKDILDKIETIHKNEIKLEEEEKENFKNLFKEHTYEISNPESYQKDLEEIKNNLVNTTIKIEQTILDKFSTPYIDKICENIYIELASEHIRVEDIDFVVNNLKEIIRNYLVLGKYEEIFDIYFKLRKQNNLLLQAGIYSIFIERDFVDEVLSGLVTWGKPNFDNIKKMIELIKEFSIEPMLDNLVTEETMSIRRFYIDRLVEYGVGVLPYIYERLNDNRWYFVRNLVVILRNFKNEETKRQLRTLLGHENNKVKYEVIQNLVIFEDAIAEKQLLRDLHSEEKDIVLNAINIIGYGKSKNLENGLIKLLDNKSYNETDIEIKKHIVFSLIQMESQNGLISIKEIFKAKSLFNYVSLKKLKLYILDLLNKSKYKSARDLYLEYYKTV